MKNTILNIVPQERVCNICNIIKPLVDFHTDTTGTFGRKARCKSCCNKVQRERDYPKNKRSGLKNRPDKVLKLYGVTYAHVVKVLESQLGLCANRGCGKEIFLEGDHGANKAVIDHDHKTGKFRAVLCTVCNMLLGKIENDRNQTMGLLEYLTEHRTEKSNFDNLKQEK